MKKTKKQQKLTNLIILDASGSMVSKLEEVRGGIKQIFNTIKEDAKKSPKGIFNTIVVDFASANDFNVIVNSPRLEDLKDSVADEYITRGMTALLDAIGKGFALIPKDSDAVFISIITDGAENDSKEYTTVGVQKLIADAKTKKWGVTFMGTTEDAINQAKTWGIGQGSTMTFADSKDGVKKALSKLNTIRAYYSAMVNDDMWMNKSEEKQRASLDNLVEDSND